MSAITVVGEVIDVCFIRFAEGDSFMAVPHALLDSSIIERLGTAGVQQLRDSLWAGDCQLCGRPIPKNAVSVSIDEMLTHVTASLFHFRCRSSQWNDRHAIPTGNATFLSWSARALVIPARDESTQLVGQMPIMLVNPGLEIVTLKHSPQGFWSVSLATLYSAHLTPPSAGVVGDEPIAGWIAYLEGSTVTVSTGLASVFSMTANPQSCAMITDQGGVMLALTHAVNPAEITDYAQLLPVIKGDRTRFGWVKLG